MSSSKKTQKELIAELTKAVENLSRRVMDLESQGLKDKYPYNPRKITRKKCVHCHGTGIIEDNNGGSSPFQPYYNNDAYNGSSWGV
jgi:cytochrome c|eukprot:SAG25_NODE_6492_length_555_cov_0.778509_2_plen_86_part_00